MVSASEESESCEVTKPYNKEPLVTCVMLTRNREQMAVRAVRAFEAQTYKRRRLLVLDGSDAYSVDLASALAKVRQHLCYCALFAFERGTLSVGQLRQMAIRRVEQMWPMESDGPDLIAHWDDDDWSSPHRLEYQVMQMAQGLMEGVSAFHRMLFWDQEHREAWEYRGTPLGTSLLYPRALAMQIPFNEGPGAGEDTRWLSELRVRRVPIFSGPAYDPKRFIRLSAAMASGDPLMVAGIHRTNHTSNGYDYGQMCQTPQHWTRKPEFDRYCAERFV